MCRAACLKVEMKAPNVIAKPLKEQQELEPCRKFALNMWGHMFLYHHNARHSLRKVSTLYELLIMSNSLEFYLKGDNISRCNCILLLFLNNGITMRDSATPIYDYCGTGISVTYFDPPKNISRMANVKCNRQNLERLRKVRKSGP